MIENKMSRKNVRFSIVAPCYNEEKVLHDLYERVKKVMDKTKETWELLLINDGSRDNTLEIMKELHKNDNRVHYISLSRNFGGQAAITAGMDNAAGDAIVLIDADLQDPPELILELIDKWKEGYDVVYAVRSERQGETIFKKATASIFYRLIDKITSIKIPMDTGEFRLMDRKVVDTMKQIREKNRFIRGLTCWVGFRQTGVKYKRDERLAGETHYTLKKMVKLALDAITGFSYKPIELFSYLGAFSVSLGLILLIIMLILKTSGMNESLSQITIPAMVIFFGGVQMLSVGVLGEYIGRIYDEVRARPLYVVREKE